MFSWKKNKERATPPSLVRDDRVTVENQKESLCRGASFTHIGTREYQQDACYLSDIKSSYTFAILCDGMGGMALGEQASAFVVEELRETLAQLRDPDSVPTVFANTLKEINQKMLRCFVPGEGGTTLVAAVIWDEKFYWASVGDSRIYIVRGGEMVQVTRDHNYAMELDQLASLDKISWQEARSDPQREALISYLGIPKLELMDINPLAFCLEPGDVILLCSDGLTKALHEQAIQRVIEQNKDCRQMVKELVEAAMEAEGASKDNTTVICLSYPLLSDEKTYIKEGDEVYEAGEM